MTETTPQPSRAAFLCNGTADFHPPDWAGEPVDENAHGRLEAYRETRHCATYMIATKSVTILGRDQDSCDHVLGNPSISRKHAAVIHDDAGGIYMVDLMSRHGTYVAGKKIPPHDPFLLHEGDVIKFGQSIRVYMLKGAWTEGSSAPVKKGWGRVKLRTPRVRISSVLPKRQPRVHASAAVTKLVNGVCYGTFSEEKLEPFISAVMELSNDEKNEVADLLVERLQAKFEFYAAHVHRNAFIVTTALLKNNMCVEEFEANLAIFTHISQQRHDSLYRADARKLLQLLAAVRLNPDNVHSPTEMHSYDDHHADEHDNEVGACPPTANHRGGRERVLSNEGKKLFLAGHGMQYQPDANSIDSEVPSNGGYGYNGRAYAQSTSTTSENSSIQEARPETSGFSFMARGQSNGRAVSPIKEPASSAFGFIASTEPDNDEISGSTERPSEQSVTGFDFMSNGAASDAGPKPPSVSPSDFLVEHVSIDQGEFEEMWESTNESEEWSTELADSFNPDGLRSCLEAARLSFVSSDKIGGQLQLLFCAEQQSTGAVFLVEVMIMPGMSDMTVTLKWIVSSLLYDNGHMLLMEIFQYAVHQFCQEEHHEYSRSASTADMNPPRQFEYTRSGSSADYSQPPQVQQPQHHYPPPPQQYQQPQAQEYHQQEQQTHYDTEDGNDGDENEDEEEEEESESDENDDELVPVEDYLTENAEVDAGKFEQLWSNSAVVGTLAYEIEEIPEKDDVIAHFRSNYLSCLASGCVDQMFKFYFFAEMVELQTFFCVELVIDADAGSVAATIKRFAAQTLDEEELLDVSFVKFFEKVLQEM